MSLGLRLLRSTFSPSWRYTYQHKLLVPFKVYTTMTFPRYTPTRVLTPDDNEVVEDSEPEREERRRTMVKKSSQRKTRPKTNPVDVIELSSDDSLPPNPTDRSHMAPIVIDISGMLLVYTCQTTHSSIFSSRRT